MPDAVGSEEDVRGRSIEGFESGEVCSKVRVYIGGRYWCRGGRRTSERRVENESEQRTSREGSSGDVERTESALGRAMGDEDEDGWDCDGLRRNILDGNAGVWRQSSRGWDESRYGLGNV